MIDLADAATIARIASDSIGAFDKIYRSFADFAKKKEPSAPDIHPPSVKYVDDPGKNAIVAESTDTGTAYQTITYEQLTQRLNGSDLGYFRALSNVMKSYETQWNVTYEQTPFASAMEIGQLEAKLDYLSRKLSEPLIKILDFVEKMGFHLDDHYAAAREIAKIYVQGR